jgi:signal transduction histidine kinase
MSLHRVLTIFAVTVAVLALGAAISLILLTTYLHRATIDLESGLHSVRLAEEMQIDLLSYIRTVDESERNRIENDVRQKLELALQYAGTPAENRSLSDVSQSLDGYFAAAHAGKQPPESMRQEAFSALRQFVNLNINQANASLGESEQLDHLGDRIGITVAITLVIGTTILLIWLHRVAFRPLFAIRDAMKKFAAGRKEARTAINGPEEFKSIAAQFNEMADALARQHQNQTAFLAGVAHDLRNPISALKISADVLSGPGVSPEKLTSLMGVIKRQVSSLNRMISDLLDSARIEAGHLDLRLEELDARTIAQDAFDLFSSASKKHEFNLVLPDTPLPLRCDPVRVGQVLHNLLSNAFKYSPDGGQVTLTVGTTGNCALFQVSDQGRGIPQEELIYIFEPFRRVGASKQDVPGVGLGLSVAQRIVHAHGGRIEVKSEMTKGTTFSVYLPLPPALQASA